MINDISNDLVEFLAGVTGIVEATRFEQTSLWRDFRGTSWVENRSGFLPTVGKLKDRPICISLFTAKINGKKILFWHATSQLVDYNKIDQWFAKHLPGVRKTDAGNFHIIL